MKNLHWSSIPSLTHMHVCYIWTSVCVWLCLCTCMYVRWVELVSSKRYCSLHFSFEAESLTEPDSQQVWDLPVFALHLPMALGLQAHALPHPLHVDAGIQTQDLRLGQQACLPPKHLSSPLKQHLMLLEMSFSPKRIILGGLSSWGTLYVEILKHFCVNVDMELKNNISLLLCFINQNQSPRKQFLSTLECKESAGFHSFIWLGIFWKYRFILLCSYGLDQNNPKTKVKAICGSVGIV